MEKYPKIQTVYLRDPETKYKILLTGQWALPEFEYLANNEWSWSEKIDGTNIRVDWDGNVRFGGRTENSQTPTFLIEKLLGLFPTDRFVTIYPDTSMTLYGEGYGARIQKGGGNYIPDDVNFILFDVMVGGVWLKREDVEDIAGHLDIDVVPIVGTGTLPDAVKMVQEGFQSRVGTQIAEGLVMRPAVELCNRMGHRIITKIKHKDF